jgi:hypothetical protein
MEASLALAILEEASKRFLGTAQDHKDIEQAISVLKELILRSNMEKSDELQSAQAIAVESFPEPNQQYDL